MARNPLRGLATLLPILLAACGQKAEVPPVPTSMRQIDAGYRSSAADWRDFLACWRDGVQARLARTPNHEGWRGLPDDVNTLPDDGAEAALAALESRLGQKLPASYRHFVQASGGAGWYAEALGDDEVQASPRVTFWSPARVAPYPQADARDFKIWIDTQRSSGPLPPLPPARYYRYGTTADPRQAQDGIDWRVDSLPHLVMVGGLGSGAGLFLNPREVTADGEWEAWLLSFKTFATRYRSFAELMQAAAAEDLGNVGVSQIGAADVARQPCLAKITTVVTRR